jgi:hypothetical protein
MVHDGYSLLEWVQQYDSKEKLFSVKTIGFLARKFTMFKTGVVRTEDYWSGGLTITMEQVVRLRRTD